MVYTICLMYIYIYIRICFMQVVSCLDDTNQSTRLVSCKVLQLLFTEKRLWQQGICITLPVCTPTISSFNHYGDQLEWKSAKVVMLNIIYH